MSDPIRSLTALNCFDSLFFSSRCIENRFRLFFGLCWVCTSSMRESVKNDKMEILVFDSDFQERSDRGHFTEKG